MADENQKFHLGICMAGAVTAGSYTAGVLDYILESLERWQKQKDANRIAEAANKPLPFPDAPMHDVVIEVVTGASAGGMSAAIATAMFVEGYTVEDLANKRSKLYKAWIELDDDNSGETLVKMLDTSDLENDGLVSILNSEVITRIAQKMVNTLSESNLPPYVDPKLDTILTISNLRGTNYSIEFKSYGATKKHTMTLHRDFMHFRLNETPGQNDDFLNLDFSNPDHIKLLQESAKATGAFPVGLRAVKLERDSTYFYNKANAIVGISNAAEAEERQVNVKVSRTPGKVYDSLNIDGGTFNNEPFGETERILSKKAKKASGEDVEHNKTNRAVIMIDPFPSKEESEDLNYLEPGIQNLVPRILGALRAESMFKAQDILDSFSENNFLKYLIFPSKSNVKEPLHCSSLGAFGGFLHRSFREHDYILGRRNAQQFIRKHFAMPYSENEKGNNLIHQGWTKNAINTHRVLDDGTYYLPIIPDMLTSDPASAISREALESVSKKFPVRKLKELEAPLAMRIDAAMMAIEKTIRKTASKDDLELLEKEKKSWFKKLGNKINLKIKQSVLQLVLSTAKQIVRNFLVKKVIEHIRKDLNEAGLLENADQKTN